MESFERQESALEQKDRAEGVTQVNEICSSRGKRSGKAAFQAEAAEIV
jgi:hypothetical protein